MARDLSRSRAILIGSGSCPQLDVLPSDSCVGAVNELLQGELCGWPRDRVTVLHDPAAPDELARNVIKAVRDVKDVLLLYFVGHGLRTRTGQLALVLHETDPDPEALPHTAMLYANLADILRGCPATTKLVILDCCHAELGGKDNFLFQGADLAETDPVDGLYFIGASKRDEKAKYPESGNLTYFTKALIDVVRSGIPGQAEELRLDQIFLELRGRLVRARLPEPVDAGIRGARQFPFARNAAWRGDGPLPPPKPPEKPKFKDVISSLISGILSLRRRPFQSRSQNVRYRFTMRGILLVALMVLATVVTMVVLPDSSSGSMKQLWSLDAGTAHGSQNSYIGSWTSGNMVAVGFTNSITGYSLNSGKELWVWAPPAGQQLCEMSSGTGGGIGMIAYESDTQASTTGVYKICQAMTAINLATGRDSWASPVSLKPQSSGGDKGSGEGIVIEGDTVATLEGDENIYGYSLSTGTQLWSSASAYPNGVAAACGSKLTHFKYHNFNYSNIAGSGSSVYVDYSCWGSNNLPEPPYLSYILGFSMSTGASTLNITLAGACKAVGVSGLWYYSGKLIADCGKGEGSAEDSFEIIGPSNSQLSVTIPTDTTDTLQSLGNQTGQILSQRFVVAGDFLYAEGNGSTGANTVLAVDLNSGQTLWSRPVPGSAELSFIGVSNSRPLTVLCEDTPSQTPEIAMATYTSTGSEAVGSSLASPAVTASSGDTFLEDGTDLVDINGSAIGASPFITVYSNVYAA